MTNWKALQVAPLAGKEKGSKGIYARPGDVLVRHLSMGSWHADGSKGGKATKPMKTKELGGGAAVTKGKK